MEGVIDGRLRRVDMLRAGIGSCRDCGRGRIMNLEAAEEDIESRTGMKRVQPFRTCWVEGGKVEVDEGGYRGRRD